jgi:hypothetical protein
VCLVSVQGDGKFEMTQTKYRLTEEQKHEEGSKLFDFCAECLKSFIDQYTSEESGIIKPGQELPLGFTVGVASFGDVLSDTSCPVLVPVHVCRSADGTVRMA